MPRILTTKWGNEPTTLTIRGTSYPCRSKLEARTAWYLEFLLQAKEILGWSYELQRFQFCDVKTNPRSYLPDFTVTVCGKHGRPECELWECKGTLLPKDVAKFRRMHEYHADSFHRLFMIFDANKKKREETSCYRTLLKYAEVKILGSTFRKLGL